MQIEDEEWVSHTLMEYERKQCISKVLSIDSENAVAKGNNFACELLKLNLKVVLNSGDVTERPVVFKMVPKTEVRRAFLKSGNIHRKESRVYAELLPDIEKIRSEKEYGVERLSPICYGIQKGHEGLLLEDLKATDFRMVDRRKGLDFAHAEVAIKAMAEFHASTRTLIERGDINVKDFSDSFQRDNAYKMEPMYAMIMNMTISNIEKWGDEWIEYANKLKEMMKSFLPLMVKSLSIEDNNVNTIIHGDYWLTNMMFRYNSEGQPQNIRLIDFQFTQYNNVGIDLRYFFNSSLNMQTFSRRQELLKIYYNQLIASLALYGFAGKVPTHLDILESYDRARFWGLFVGLCFRPTVMQPQEAVPDDLEELTKKMMENCKMEMPPFQEDLQEVLKCLLKSAVEEGII